MDGRIFKTVPDAVGSGDPTCDFKTDGPFGRWRPAETSRPSPSRAPKQHEQTADAHQHHGRRFGYLAIYVHDWLAGAARQVSVTAATWFATSRTAGLGTAFPRSPARTLYGWAMATASINPSRLRVGCLRGGRHDPLYTATFTTTLRTAAGLSSMATPGIWPSSGKKIAKLPAGTVTKLPAPSYNS